MVAVVGLTGAIVILANDQDEVSNPTAAKPLESVNQPGSARYDGAPRKAGAASARLPRPARRLVGHPPSARFLRRGRG